MKSEPLLTLLLLAGADDWVSLVDVERIVFPIGGPQIGDEVREKSLRVIREVVCRGLMEIGELDGGFRKWDLPDEEALDRVDREWRASQRQVLRGDICWLRNTEKGDAITEELQRKRDSLRGRGEK